MKAIYLLYDGEKTKIPAYDIDKNLHTLFTGAVNGGVYEADSCTYIFNRKLDTEKLSALLPDTAVGKLQEAFAYAESILGSDNHSYATMLGASGFAIVIVSGDDAPVKDGNTIQIGVDYLKENSYETIIVAIHTLRTGFASAFAKSAAYLVEANEMTKLFC